MDTITILPFAARDTNGASDWIDVSTYNTLFVHLAETLADGDSVVVQVATAADPFGLEVLNRDTLYPGRQVVSPVDSYVQVSWWDLTGNPSFGVYTEAK